MNALRLVLFVLLFAVAVVSGSAVAHAAEISVGHAGTQGMIA